MVELKVRWRRHPLNPEGAEGVWGFQMKRVCVRGYIKRGTVHSLATSQHDSFKILFDEVADIAEVLTEDVIVTFQGKRIFASASPHGIGVWAQAELGAANLAFVRRHNILTTYLDACDRSTFEHLQTSRHRSPAANNALDLVNAPLSRGTSPISIADDSAAPSEPEDDSGDEDTLKITLRSALTKPLTLTVRQTTKCHAILQAFFKHHKLTDKYTTSPAKGKKSAKGKAKPAGPALVVDGDRLNPDDEISVADLEDGDVVDVVGL